jgi:prepilin-type N-terminal cleavage/methylation domain-containing protein
MKNKTTRGYTLIEMMVVMAISILTMLVVTTAIYFFYKANGKALNQGYAIENAREGVQLAVRDTRGIQYGADGSYPIYSIAPLAFTFYADTNKDGVSEKISYFLQGTNFVRGITYANGSVYPANSEVDTVLSKYVQNGIEGKPIFHYFDASSTEQNSLSIVDPVTYVTVLLVVNASTTSDYTLRSTAALRNVSQF